MCMMAGAVFANVAVLATDTRINAYPKEGDPIRLDLGKKMTRLPHGYVTGSGDGFLTMAVMDEVRRTEPRTLEAVSEAIGRMHEKRSRAPYPGEFETTRFLVTLWDPIGMGPELWELTASGERGRGGGVGNWRAEMAGPPESGAVGYIVSSPPEMEGALDVELRRSFAESLDSATSLPAILRAFGAAFCRASEVADSMSADGQVGVIMPGRAVDLAFPAIGLATLKDDDLRRAFAGAEAA